MGDFTVNVRQKPMDFNRWQLGLYYHMGLFHVQETGTMLRAMLLLVGLVDACSNWLRTRAMP